MKETHSESAPLPQAQNSFAKDFRLDQSSGTNQAALILAHTLHAVEIFHFTGKKTRTSKIPWHFIYFKTMFTREGEPAPVIWTSTWGKGSPNLEATQKNLLSSIFWESAPQFSPFQLRILKQEKNTTKTWVYQILPTSPSLRIDTCPYVFYSLQVFVNQRNKLQIELSSPTILCVLQLAFFTHRSILEISPYPCWQSLLVTFNCSVVLHGYPTMMVRKSRNGNSQTLPVGM